MTKKPKNIQKALAVIDVLEMSLQDNECKVSRSDDIILTDRFSERQKDHSFDAVQPLFPGIVYVPVRRRDGQFHHQVTLLNNVFQEIAGLMGRTPIECGESHRDHENHTRGRYVIEVRIPEPPTEYLENARKRLLEKEKDLSNAVPDDFINASAVRKFSIKDVFGLLLNEGVREIDEASNSVVIPINTGRKEDACALATIYNQVKCDEIRFKAEPSHASLTISPIPAEKDVKDLLRSIGECIENDEKRAGLENRIGNDASAKRALINAARAFGVSEIISILEQPDSSQQFVR